MSESSRRPSGELRHDVEAALEARRELGPDYEDHVAAGLAERVDELVAMRMAEARVAGEERRLDREDERLRRGQRLALGIVSLGTGVPITAIAGHTADSGVVGIAIAWAGIVGVNLAAAWAGRRRP